MVESKTTEEIHDMGVNLASNGMMKELKEFCDKRWLPFEETMKALYRAFPDELFREVIKNTLSPAKPTVRDNSNLRMRPTPSVRRKRGIERGR